MENLNRELWNFLFPGEPIPGGLVHHVDRGLDSWDEPDLEYLSVVENDFENHEASQQAEPEQEE